MNSILSNHFNVDKQNKRISVHREFTAPLFHVWAAWTKSEYLDQWWAPPPCSANTLRMDFGTGGYWLYAVLVPNVKKKFARIDYLAVREMKGFSTQNSFCDESGKINNNAPVSCWEIEFTEADAKTFVDIVINFTSVADIEQLIAMGFQNGLLSALGNLESMFITKS